MKQKSKKIHFQANGQEISSGLLDLYQSLKASFEIIQLKIKKSQDFNNSIEICQEMLKTYTIAQEILQSLLSECFGDNFYLNIEKMGRFFEFLNKICRVMVAMDFIKIQNPIIFSKYCEAKLKNMDVFERKVDDGEDNKICVLHLISLPFGRMFLSFFCHPSFDLNRPAFLDKNIKVHLNEDSIKRISLYIYLIEKDRLKYLIVYFIALFYRLTKTDPFMISDPEMKRFENYLNMLKLQN